MCRALSQVLGAWFKLWGGAGGEPQGNTERPPLRQRPAHHALLHWLGIPRQSSFFPVSSQRFAPKETQTVPSCPQTVCGITSPQCLASHEPGTHSAARGQEMESLLNVFLAFIRQCSWKCINSSGEAQTESSPTPARPAQHSGHPEGHRGGPRGLGDPVKLLGNFHLSF